MCVKVIASQMWDVFWDTVYMYLDRWGAGLLPFMAKEKTRTVVDRRGCLTRSGLFLRRSQSGHSRHFSVISWTVVTSGLSAHAQTTRKSVGQRHLFNQRCNDDIDRYIGSQTEPPSNDCCDVAGYGFSDETHSLFMAALWNRAGHHIFALWFLLFIFLFSFFFLA